MKIYNFFYTPFPSPPFFTCISHIYTHTYIYIYIWHFLDRGRPPPPSIQMEVPKNNNNNKYNENLHINLRLRDRFEQLLKARNVDPATQVNALRQLVLLEGDTRRVHH